MLRAHGGRLPLVDGAHRHGDVAAVLLDLVEHGEELGLGGRHSSPSSLKMSLLYMKPWITEAIGTQNVAEPSSVLQAASAKSGKFCSSGMPVSVFELAVLEQPQRRIERPAGDQVAGGAAIAWPAVPRRTPWVPTAGT